MNCTDNVLYCSPDVVMSPVRYIGRPLGQYYELSERLPRPPTPSPVLEKEFKKNKRLTANHKAVEVS